MVGWMCGSRGQPVVPGCSEIHEPSLYRDTCVFNHPQLWCVVNCRAGIVGYCTGTVVSPVFLITLVFGGCYLPTVSGLRLDDVNIMKPLSSFLMYFKFSFCKDNTFVGFTNPVSPAQLLGHDSIYSALLQFRSNVH